jgi:hypothetical protein
MKSGFPFKAVGLTFVVALALYCVIFYGIEYRRRYKGPWEVTFVSDAQGNPSVIIYQPKLRISAVEVLFLGERLAVTNLSEKVSFDQPKKAIPFGKRLFEDLTFLPGVETFDFFGHEVELLPRVLVVNKKEVPWQSEAVLELSPTNKLSIMKRK